MEDPGELRNVVAAHDQVSRRLNEKLTKWKEAVAIDAPQTSRYVIDSEIQKHLEELGYL